MKLQRMAAAATATLIGVATPSAQAGELWSYVGDNWPWAYGFSVAPLGGDADGDGVWDVVVGGFAAFADKGIVRVHSGATGAVVCGRVGADFGDQLGDVGRAGDVDGDGTPDFIAGAAFNDTNGVFQSGRAWVFSGDDCSTICAFDGLEVGGLFGFAVSGVGDVDLDGLADVAVGAPFEGGDQRGKVHVFSGVECNELWYTRGVAANDHLGWSVGFVGDMDGDGDADVLAGAPDNDAAGTDAGVAYVFEKLAGAPFGTPIYTYTGENAGDRFGASVAGFGANITGSSDLDVAIGAPYHSNVGYTENGKVYVYSGGTLAYARNGTEDDAHFGTSVANGFDIDGDGVRDLVVGASGAAGGKGRFSVFAGDTGVVFASYDGEAVGHGFGADVAGLGDDVDGDGYREVIVGAPSWNDGTSISDGKLYLYTPTPTVGGGCDAASARPMGGAYGLLATLALAAPFAALVVRRRPRP